MRRTKKNQLEFLISLLSVSLFISACAATVSAPKPVPGAENIRIDAPSYRVGDEWRYSPGTFVRVVDLRDGLVVTESNTDQWCEGCRYFRDRNLVAVKILDAQGRPHEYAMAGADLKLLDFPLYVGKAWSQDTKLRRPSGVIVPYSSRVKVEAYEEVTVKAGTFKAFRISWELERAAAYDPWGTPFHGKSAMWWSPEVRAFVKREVYSRWWGEGWELVSYTLGGAPQPGASSKP